MKKLLPIILLLLLLAGQAWGADTSYYVTESGAGSQDGTAIGDAWAISDFNSSANWSATDDAVKIDPGDTVYFSGTFSTAPDPQGHGAAGNYIVLDGDDGISSAATIESTVTGGYDECIRADKDYIEWQDFTITNTDSSSGSGIALYVYQASYNKIHDCTINGHWRFGIFSNYSDNIEIYENTVTSTYTGAFADGIKNKASNNIDIYQNTIYDWSHTAVECLNDKNDYAYGDTYQIDIYSNYIYLPNRGYGRAFDASSWEVSGNTRYIYFHHNYIKNMRTRTHASQGANYVYIYRNLFYNTKQCCQSAGDNGCTEVAADSECDNEYYANGQTMDISNNYGDIEHIYIINNTIYMSAETAIMVHNTGAVDNLHIQNNLIYDAANACDGTSENPDGSTTDRYDFSIGFWDPDDITNSTCQNNLFYSPDRTTGDDIAYDAYDRLNYTVAEFNSNVAWASNNVNSDPNSNFTDTGAQDFSLTSGSPAIDAGQTNDALYSQGWSAATSKPPIAVTTLNDGDNGSAWEIGTWTYGSDETPTEEDWSDAKYVGVYLFESSPGFLNDSSGEGETLTNFNGAEISANSTYYKEGEQSAGCSGAATALLYNTSIDSTTDVTYGVWFRPSGVSGTQHLIGLWGNNNNQMQIRLVMDDDGLQGQISSDDAGTTETTSTHATSLSTNTWYLGFLSYEHSTKAYRVRLYDSDGNHLGTDITGNFTNQREVSTNNTGISFAADMGISERFTGQLDMGVVVDEVMSTSEMDDLVGTDISGTWDDLLYISDPFGSPTIDSSPSAISTSGTHYIAVECSTEPYIEGSPNTGDFVFTFSYGSTTGLYKQKMQVDTGDGWTINNSCIEDLDYVMILELSLEPGDRITDIVLSSVTTDGWSIVTEQDVPWDTTVPTTSGTIAVEVPLSGSNAVTIGSAGDYTDFSDAENTLDHFLDEDEFTILDSIFSTNTDLTGKPNFTIDADGNKLTGTWVIDGQTLKNAVIE